MHAWSSEKHFRVISQIIRFHFFRIFTRVLFHGVEFFKVGIVEANSSCVSENPGFCPIEIDPTCFSTEHNILISIAQLRLEILHLWPVRTGGNQRHLWWINWNATLQRKPFSDNLIGDVSPSREVTAKCLYLSLKPAMLCFVAHEAVRYPSDKLLLALGTTEAMWHGPRPHRAHCTEKNHIGYLRTSWEFQTFRLG